VSTVPECCKRKAEFILLKYGFLITEILMNLYKSAVARDSSMLIEKNNSADLGNGFDY
jgi:hypothetical protein